MASPTLDVQFELPEKPLEQTYNEIVESLTCPSCNGAQIRPSGLHPSATLNLGDAIADITSHLTSFTNGYSIILAILKMIGCIIEVICAIANPFALIPAVVRLFAVCLPEFILIFPLFVVPCIIFCFIKIFLAIVQYILTYIVPIILDLVNNIQDLVEAFQNDNGDAQEAVAFKLAGLLQELFSVVGILAVLGAIFDMIQALLAQGIGIPCGGGSNDDCAACTDPLCPDIIQVDSFSATDGVLYVLIAGDGSSFSMRFTSPSHKNDFLTIRNNGLFPNDLDLSLIEDSDDLPYNLRVSGQDFAVTSIDNLGSISMSSIPNEFVEDGYLSSVRSAPAPTLETPISDPDIRFATDTVTFESSMVPVYITDLKTYVEIQDTRTDTEDSENNFGTFEIKEYIDEYNVIITRADGLPWEGVSDLDSDPFIAWRLLPRAPTPGNSLNYTFTTNHDVLLKYGLIGTGCHPSVKEARAQVASQFPELAASPDGSVSAAGAGDIPDLNGLVDDLNSQLETLQPADKDYILDNYDALADAVDNLDLETPLNAFSDALVDYSRELAPLVVDVQNAAFDANPKIKEVGNNIVVTITPVNYAGTPLSFGFPPGVLEIEITPTAGQISELTEVLDEDGAPTGTFQGLLTSLEPTLVELTAQVNSKYVADFDGVNLVTRVIEVEFTLPEEQIGRDPSVAGEVSSEPLGKSTNAGE